ncbi:hypothetical protein, partial [Nostoc sp. CALU 1950]|uniref:hypothetical protein n=1 Tax=Nostoc sp. CALU 1950 TaxID=3104321 RepID=UPI003EBEEC25
QKQPHHATKSIYPRWLDLVYFHVLCPIRNSIGGQTRIIVHPMEEEILPSFAAALWRKVHSTTTTTTMAQWLC